MDVKLELNGFDDAIRRNPQVVRQEVKNFLVRGMAVYRQGIQRSPWRIGKGGGGSPVATGALRDTHQVTYSEWEAKIEPTTKYAEYVHEGTSRMQSRPWLEDAKDTSDSRIKALELELLDKILYDLAK